MKNPNALIVKPFISLSFVFAAVVLAGAAGVAVAGDEGDAPVSRNRELQEFDRIRVAGAYELKVEVGGEFSVDISGSEKALERVEAYVKDGTLVLDQHGKNINGFHLESLTAKVSMPALRSIDVSGVVDAEIEGIDADEFTAHLGGVGDIELSGTCRAIDAHVSGIGELDAKKLHCKSAEVRVSGIGSASVYASEEVVAKSSGVGGIDIYGSPRTVRKDASVFSGISVQ